jgi:hypothetical protein
MTMSMYAASVPLFRQMLGALAAVLDKGAAFAAERAIDPATLLDARLAPDMFPLVRQVQIASDMAKGGAARLAGVEVPKYPDEERSFPELGERIARTLGFIDTVPAERIDGSEEREIVVPLRDRELRFSGERFLRGFVIPNFMFHCTTAYAILRHNGVPLGKRDFLGAN